MSVGSLMRILEKDSYDRGEGRKESSRIHERAVERMIKNIDRLKSQMIDGHKKPKSLLGF